MTAKLPYTGEYVGAYYDLLLKTIARHPEAMTSFLRLASFSDGDIAEEIADHTAWLSCVVPDEFASALRGLSPAAQRRVVVAESCREYLVKD